MECELCGQSVRGRLIRVRIEGVVLMVCERCAKKYSEYIIQEPVRHASERRKPTRIRPRIRSSDFLEYDIVDDYSKKIREARESLGMTRELLARRIGEKESVIRRLEEGSLVPTIDLAQRLERALGIKLIVRRSEEEAYINLQESSRFELTLGDIVVIKERRRRSEKRDSEGNISGKA